MIILENIPGKKSSAQPRFFRHISPFKKRTEIINISQENLIQSGKYTEVKTKISSLMHELSSAEAIWGSVPKKTKSQFLLSIMRIATKIHTTLIKSAPHQIHQSLYLPLRNGRPFLKKKSL